MPLKDQPSVWVDVVPELGRIVLHVFGDLDVVSRQVVTPQIVAASSSSENVTLNLSHVTFCDSSGLAVLVTAVETVRANGGTLRFEDVPPNVRYVFAATGLNDLLLTLQ